MARTGARTGSKFSKYLESGGGHVLSSRKGRARRTGEGVDGVLLDDRGLPRLLARAEFPLHHVGQAHEKYEGWDRI